MIGKSVRLIRLALAISIAGWCHVSAAGDFEGDPFKEITGEAVIATFMQDFKNITDLLHTGIDVSGTATNVTLPMTAEDALGTLVIAGSTAGAHTGGYYAYFRKTTMTSSGLIFGVAHLASVSAAHGTNFNSASTVATTGYSNLAPHIEIAWEEAFTDLQVPLLTQLVNPLKYGFFEATWTADTTPPVIVCSSIEPVYSGGLTANCYAYAYDPSGGLQMGLYAVIVHYISSNNLDNGVGGQGHQFLSYKSQSGYPPSRGEYYHPDSNISNLRYNVVFTTYDFTVDRNRALFVALDAKENVAFCPDANTAPVVHNFNASSENDEVRLRWIALRSEADSHFNILRAEGYTSPLMRVNRLPIQVVGGARDSLAAYTFLDQPTMGWTELLYALELVNDAGEASTVAVTTAHNPNAALLALAAWPNPSSGLIEFSWRPGHTPAEIRVFDVRGRLVRVLSPGDHNVARWNGLAENGERVAGGTYVATITVDHRVASKKILIAR